MYSPYELIYCIDFERLQDYLKNGGNVPMKRIKRGLPNLHTRLLKKAINNDVFVDSAKIIEEPIYGITVQADDPVINKNELQLQAPGTIVLRWDTRYKMYFAMRPASYIADYVGYWMNLAIMTPLAFMSKDPSELIKRVDQGLLEGIYITDKQIIPNFSQEFLHLGINKKVLNKLPEDKIGRVATLEFLINGETVSCDMYVEEYRFNIFGQAGSLEFTPKYNRIFGDYYSSNDYPYGSISVELPKGFRIGTLTEYLADSSINKKYRNYYNNNRSGFGKFDLKSNLGKMLGRSLNESDEVLLRTVKFK